MKIIKGCLGKHFLQNITATKKTKQSRADQVLGGWSYMVPGPPGADQKEVALWDLHVCVDPS